MNKILKVKTEKKDGQVIQVSAVYFEKFDQGNKQRRVISKDTRNERCVDEEHVSQEKK
jgi:hypothetical protein